MATIFGNMKTPACAAGSALNQPQQQQQLNLASVAAVVSEPLSDCIISPTSGSLSGISTSSSSSSSTSLAVPSCSSTCSSVSRPQTTSAGTLTGLTTSTSSTGAVSAVSLTSVTSSSLAVSASIATTTLPSLTCSTQNSSQIEASVATSSENRLLINGFGASDAELSAANSTSLTEDPRALQLALELSMVGLNDSLQMQVPQHQLHQHQQQKLQQLQQQHLQHMHHQQSQQQQPSVGSFDMSTLSAAVAAAAAAAHTSTVSTASAQLNQFSTSLLHNIEDRSKKSQNMTECVPVPSSEHVAEIVGRQGCKIKALRAKTNTYIKTPVRGEEPVFVVTGRKEDVAKAKREILSAAEHFSVIRASRKPSFSSSLTGCTNSGCGKPPPGPPSFSGHVTIKVRVPYRVVGLVVGSKGATIKHIQQDTQTYIVTPSREREPIFDVTGLPHHVQAARKQIEAHIALRTGATDVDAVSGTGNTNDTVHTINSLSQILTDDVSPEFLASIYKNGLCSTFDSTESSTASVMPITSEVPMGTNNNGINLNLPTSNLRTQSLVHKTLLNAHNNFAQNNGSSDIFYSMTGTVDSLNSHHVYDGSLNPNTNSNNYIATLLNESAPNTTNLKGSTSVSASNGVTCNANGMSRSCSSASSTTSSKSTNNGSGSNCSRPELSNIWKNLGDSLDVDEGIGESPSIWTLPCVLNTPVAQYSSSTTSISPTDSLLRESNSFGQLLAIQSQPQQQQMQQLQYRSVLSGTNNNNNLTALHQQQLILQQNQQLIVRRECLVCSDKEVTAALVPCGHNMFCMECAIRICASSESNCPVCSQSVFHAMRILA